MHTCIHARTYAHTHTHTHIYIYIYIYIYIINIIISMDSIVKDLQYIKYLDLIWITSPSFDRTVGTILFSLSISIFTLRAALARVRRKNDFKNKKLVRDSFSLLLPSTPKKIRGFGKKPPWAEGGQHPDTQSAREGPRFACISNPHPMWCRRTNGVLHWILHLIPTCTW